jgi:hypothetical protein
MTRIAVLLEYKLNALQTTTSATKTSTVKQTGEKTLTLSPVSDTPSQKVRLTHIQNYLTLMQPKLTNTSIKAELIDLHDKQWYDDWAKVNDSNLLWDALRTELHACIKSEGHPLTLSQLPIGTSRYALTLSLSLSLSLSLHPTPPLPRHRDLMNILLFLYP